MAESNRSDSTRESSMKVLQVKLIAYQEHCPGKAEGAGSSPVGRTSFFSGNGMASWEADCREKKVQAGLLEFRSPPLKAAPYRFP